MRIDLDPSSRDLRRRRCSFLSRRKDRFGSKPVKLRVSKCFPVCPRMCCKTLVETMGEP